MIDQNQLKELLTELKSGLKKIYGPILKGVYLYGSYARGNSHEGSDLNIYVVLDDYKRYSKEIDRTSAVTANLSLKYGVSIHKTYAKERNWTKGITPFLYGVPEETIPA